MTASPTDAALAEMLERSAFNFAAQSSYAKLVHNLRLAASRLRSDPPVDEQGVGASLRDRASRASPQAAARLDQKATIPCAATCIITNCRRSTPAGEPFCSEHRS